MGDNQDKQLDALFAMARQDNPNTSALEAHFETRLLANLTERRSRFVPWQLMIWRMLPAFAVIVAIVLVCNFTINPTRSSDPFATITNGQDEQLAKNYLLGE